MTLLELIRHLRVSILDDTGGTGVEWEEISKDDDEAYQLRWTNEELTAHINEAESRAIRSAFLIKKTSEVGFDINVIPGTSRYSLNPKIIRVKTLESSQGLLKRAEYEDFIHTHGWRDKEGTPTHYIVDESDKSILLYPKPIAVDTLHSIYYRLPLAPFDWEDKDATSEIAEEHQIEMLDYAAHIAYMKDDANTFDPRRSEYFRQRFLTNFTDTSAYGDLRRARTRNRSIKYGGY